VNVSFPSEPGLMAKFYFYEKDWYYSNMGISLDVVWYLSNTKRLPVFSAWMKCESELKSESLTMCSNTKGWSVFMDCWREPRKEKYKFVMLDQMKLEFFKKSCFSLPQK
jgi:hypothetical protein